MIRFPAVIYQLSECDSNPREVIDLYAVYIPVFFFTKHEIGEIKLTEWNGQRKSELIDEEGDRVTVIDG